MKMVKRPPIQDKLVETEHWEPAKMPELYSTMMPIFLRNVSYNTDLIIRDAIVNSMANLDRYCTDSWYNPKASPSALDTLVIKISFERKNNCIIIADNGQGLTFIEVRNLANSMISNAMKRCDIASGYNLPIGAYSLGLIGIWQIAYKIVLVTKHETDKAYEWRSLDPTQTRIEPIKSFNESHGNRLSIYLHSKYTYYLKREQIYRLVRSLCRFVTYPIKLMEEKISITTKENTIKILDIDDPIPNAYTYKKQQSYIEEDQINELYHLWNFDAVHISNRAYTDFYKFLFTDCEDFIVAQHVFVKRNLNMHAILYIPQHLTKSPFDIETNQKNLRLYAKGRFVMYNFGQFLPEYFGFIRGIIDSASFPQHAESLMLHSESFMMDQLSCSLSEKIVELLLDLKMDSRHIYEKFYKKYSRFVKMALLDSQHREQMTNLVMYKTSKSRGKFLFLEEIVRSIEFTEQDFLYCVLGSRSTECSNSPYIEYLKSLDFAIIYMMDPIDPFVVAKLRSFHDVYFVMTLFWNMPICFNINNCWNYKTASLKYRKLCAVLLNILRREVVQVVVSKRLIQSPFCVVFAEDNTTGYLHSLKVALPIHSRNRKEVVRKPKLVLEINPKSSIIIALAKLMKKSQETTDQFQSYVRIFYGLALLISGISAPDYMPTYTRLVFQQINDLYALPLRKSPSRTAVSGQLRDSGRLATKPTVPIQRDETLSKLDRAFVER